MPVTLDQVFYFSVWACLGFAILELGASLLHQKIFHGFLWRIHESHHRPVRGRIFELNDLFAVFFAAIPMALMVTSPSVLGSAQFALGAGMTVHGVAYFVIHDLMTHRRWFALNPKGRFARAWVQAHRVHHQRVDQEGQGPWGLFFILPKSRRN
jgi:beta-carotene 3-hydroxylase